MNQLTPSQKAATAIAIQKMAYHTAQGTNQRAKDAQAHCKKLSINHTSKTFENAVNE